MAKNHELNPDTIISTQWGITKNAESRSFIYTWTIQNREFYWRCGNYEQFCSPEFSSGIDDYVWKLAAKFNSDQKNIVELYLTLVSEQRNVYYECITSINSIEDLYSSTGTRKILRGKISKGDSVDLIWIENFSEPLKDGKLYYYVAITYGVGEVTESSSQSEQNKTLDLENQNILIQDYSKLWNSGDHSDVTFFVDSKEIMAHKGILSARSSYFSAMFSHPGLVENQENVVTITDIDVEVFEDLLHYIYTGISRNLDKNASTLMIAADKYGVDGCQKDCMLYINQDISCDNVSEYLIHAHIYSSSLLKEKIFKYITTHISQVVKTDSWKTLKTSHPELICEVFESLAVTEGPIS